MRWGPGAQVFRIFLTIGNWTGERPNHAGELIQLGLFKRDG